MFRSTSEQWITFHRDDLADALSGLASKRSAMTRAPEDIQPWADGLLQDALRQGASDVHITPRSESMRIAVRIDGVLFVLLDMQKDQGNRLIRHYKAMAELDPIATFLPQVSRRTQNIAGRMVDLRLATVPTACGERMTIRVFDPTRLEQRIDELGLAEDDQNRIANWLGSVTGMFLVTGPTGSGKTTTLYALLNELKLTDRNVVTIEDPVEYQVDGVTQISVDMRHDLNFHEGVKAILRQDPDYILIGEIRDAISAHAAMNASSTGRAVMTTLHSRDAVGAVTALRNWELNDHEIATSLEVVVAQRLVRKLCPDCRRKEPPQANERKWLTGLGMPIPDQTWHAGGCSKCLGSGFRGRTGLFEVWRLNETDYDQILSHTDEHSVRHHLAERGHRPLLANGMAMVCNGVTSIEELRILGSFFVPPKGSKAAQTLIETVEALSVV